MNLFQKIKLALAARKIANQATEEVKTMDGIKPGWQTTEFWGKTLVQIVVLYNTFCHRNIDPTLGTQTVALMEGIYVAIRGLIKAFQELKKGLKKEPVVLNSIPPAA